MGRSGRDGGWCGAAVALAASGALAACGRPPPPPVRVAGGETGFLAPPTLLTAERTDGGGLRLGGRAPPDATVRLQSPDGRALGVTADASGAWTADLPPASTPELFALSAQVADRTLRGEGALATTPVGGALAALVARAGAASAVAASGPPPAAPILQAIDFDRGGGVAAAGRDTPGATLKLVVDGAEVGAGQADALGRFGLPGVGAPLAPGLHRVRVEARGRGDEATVDTAAAAPLAGAPFRTARTALGWRVDWAPPGGGVQSLVLLDARAGGAR